MHILHIIICISYLRWIFWTSWSNIWLGISIYMSTWTRLPRKRPSSLIFRINILNIPHFLRFIVLCFRVKMFSLHYLLSINLTSNILILRSDSIIILFIICIILIYLWFSHLYCFIYVHILMWWGILCLAFCSNMMTISRINALFLRNDVFIDISLFLYLLLFRILWLTPWRFIL